MKILLALALASIATAAAADKPYSKADKCMAYADAFEQSSYVRDRGQSPEHAFKYLKSIYPAEKNPPISEQQIKTAINLVYFDAAFAETRGRVIHAQILDLCANDWKGPKQFQPLK